MENPQHPHHGQRARQAHRHDHCRDQGVAQLLQEQPHHQEYQDHGFDQGVDDLLDRGLDKGRRVVRHAQAHIARQGARQMLQTRLDRLCGLQRIATRRELHRHGGHGLAVETGIEAVVLAPQLHPRHIVNPHTGAIIIGAQDNIAERLHRLQLALNHDGRGNLLVHRARTFPHATGRYLYVLRRDGFAHVRHRQAVTHQLRRVDPNAHGAFGGIHLHAADPGHTTNFVVHRAGCKVGQADRVLLLVGVRQGVDHQEVRAYLLDFQSLLDHRLGQTPHHPLQAVLHVDLRAIRVSARFEGDGRVCAAIGAGGLVVEQVRQAVEFLFQQAGDVEVDDLCRRARVAGTHADLRRRNVGVLADRQTAERQRPSQYDKQRDNPGEIRTLNEKVDHFSLRPVVQPGYRH